MKQIQPTPPYTSTHTPGTALGILIPFGGAIVLLLTPGIQHIVPQILSLIILSYVLLRVFEHFLFSSQAQQSSHDHYQHTKSTYYMALFGILLLIGETGGAHSPVQALLIGIISISAPVYSEVTIVLLCLLSPVFLMIIHDVPLVVRDVPMLLTYPIMIPVILYAKMQHMLFRVEKKQVRSLEKEEQSIQKTLQSSTLPRIIATKQALLESTPEMLERAQQHITCIEQEVRTCIQATKQ